MRGGPADGSRLVGAVNSVALAIQSQPARPDRVTDAGGNHDAGMVVSGVGDAIDDLEFSARTGANRCADCYRERADDFCAFEDSQIAAVHVEPCVPGDTYRTEYY